MNNRVFKRVLTVGLILTMVVASMAVLVFGASADHSYNNSTTKEFKVNGTNLIAGYLQVDDSYYRDSRCLYIHDTVTYTSNANTPYNVVLSGSYTFEYMDGTSNGKDFDRVANRNGYEFNIAVPTSAANCMVSRYPSYISVLPWNTVSRTKFVPVPASTTSATPLTVVNAPAVSVAAATAAMTGAAAPHVSTVVAIAIALTPTIIRLAPLRNLLQLHSPVGSTPITGLLLQ